MTPVIKFDLQDGSEAGHTHPCEISCLNETDVQRILAGLTSGKTLRTGLGGRRQVVSNVVVDSE